MRVWFSRLLDYYNWSLFKSNNRNTGPQQMHHGNISADRWPRVKLSRSSFSALSRFVWHRSEWANQELWSGVSAGQSLSALSAMSGRRRLADPFRIPQRNTPSWWFAFVSLHWSVIMMMRTMDDVITWSAFRSSLMCPDTHTHTGVCVNVIIIHFIEALTHIQLSLLHNTNPPTDRVCVCVCV